MTRTTRIIGHMVTRNELDRYLRATIQWLREITDAQFVYDDRSTDETAEYLDRQRIPFIVRPEEAPSFAEDESALRAAAWIAMEDVHQPNETDWILCVDADEFVVAIPPAETREVLTDTIERHTQTRAVTLPVKEVFAFKEDNTPLVRTDGYWGSIQACRLVQWRPDGQFPPRIEGGGSVPTAWTAGATINEDLVIMHLGYVRPEDRKAKHARYSHTGGHNPRHVASILELPSLTPWDDMRQMGRVRL